jgi:hypothetical protein
LKDSPLFEYPEVGILAFNRFVDLWEYKGIFSPYLLQKTNTSKALRAKMDTRN